MPNIFKDYKCPICNGTLRITKRLLNCGQNEWHELNRIVCNHCKVKSGEMECDLKQYKEEYWHSFNEAVKRKKERETRKPEKILTDIRDYIVRKQRGIKNSEINVIVKEVALGIFEAEMVVLKRYAEELGVEL